MKNVILKDTIKEIKNTFKRFLSILLVVFLGVGFFAGIKATSPDMKKTADVYFDTQNMMDAQVISTLGITNKDIERLKQVEGVLDVEGSYSQDVMVTIDEKDSVIRLETITSNINQLILLEGKMPETENECVVEQNLLAWTDHSIGDYITINAEKIKDDEGNEKELLKNNKMKIVGTVQSPMYISRERGNTKLGSGKINYYMFVEKKAINADISTTAYVTVQDAKTLNSTSKQYEEKIDTVKDKIEEISESRKQARYDEIYNEAESKIKEAEDKLNTEKAKADKEISDAEKKINDAKQELENGKKELDAQRRKANTEFANADKKLKSAQTELENKKKEFEVTKKEIQKQIEENKKILANLQLSQEGGNANLSETIAKLEIGIKQAEEQLASAEKQLNTAEQKLKKQKSALNNQKSKTYATLNSAEKKLEDGKKEITKNENKLKEAKKEAEEKISEAKEKLEEAKIKLKDIKKPEWYILDRNQNVGYASYIQDTDRIANLATVFPVVFFVVAALISLTSMSRMVEEERVQIGTLKALGYTKSKIASKYIIYALLATIIGSVAGLILGFRILPDIIASMYGMMYTLPKTILEFNLQYALIGILVATACTVGATIYSCIKELKQTPANLMRPKSPKVGKRVFLEKIKFIWSKMNFTQKVTARNIFRYKKRFMMTIIGVMGCTSLILAGFGLRDAVSQMIPLQYGEIFKYDVQISLKDDITTNTISEQAKKIEEMEQTTGILKANMQSVEITNIENTQNIQLIVPENIEKLSEYITLRDRINRNKTYELKENGVIITEKLAKLLKLKVGDVITLKNSDDKSIETKVASITENYLMHYIYMSPNLYKELYQEEIKSNTIFANTVELSEEEENNLGTKILENKDNVAGITFVSSTEGIFKEVMDNMNFVVWVLIIAAGLLAFVVLYNLANTNISERKRELATIKVLGFYDKEVYDYVSREMIILTLIGILIGLFAGVFLTMFIIKTCELDIMMFSTKIHWASYIYSIIITLFFAIIVNIATYFALKKIDMIESLKSVE